MNFKSLVTSAIFLVSTASSQEVDAPAIEAIRLFARSNDTRIDGLGLTSLYEGGINYMFLGANAQVLDHDDNNDLVFSDDTGFRQVLYADPVNNNVLLNNKGNPTLVDFSPSGVLYCNGGSEGFYACQNTSGPKGVSQNQFQVRYYTSDARTPSSCIAMNIVRDPMPTDPLRQFDPSLLFDNKPVPTGYCGALRGTKPPRQNINPCYPAGSRIAPHKPGEVGHSPDYYEARASGNNVTFSFGVPLAKREEEISVAVSSSTRPQHPGHTGHPVGMDLVPTSHTQSKIGFISTSMTSSIQAALATTDGSSSSSVSTYEGAAADVATLGGLAAVGFGLAAFIV